ncbi:MAG: hypothetical protein WCJ64_14810 [Rhodospirillaceae bacterium]
MVADHVWLTYKELAERLNIGVDSARHKAKRRKWATEAGNHPSDAVRIKVPLVVLERERSPVDRSLDTPPTTDPLSPGAVPRGSLPHEMPPSPGPVGVIPIETAMSMISNAERRADVEIARLQAGHKAEIERLQASHRETINLLFQRLATIAVANRPRLSLWRRLFG